MAQADIILSQVYNELGLDDELPLHKYNHINDIVATLQELNNLNPIHPKTTGTISERLCELALLASVPELYSKISNDWNWMADFSVLGHPFNVLISVKSFKAKERLIVSGSGNNLSPTIGWGLFDDVNEFGLERVKSYLYRSFVAIYMPNSTYLQIPESVREVRNINGRHFLRIIDEFNMDMSDAIVKNSLLITRL